MTNRDLDIKIKKRFRPLEVIERIIMVKHALPRQVDSVSNTLSLHPVLERAQRTNCQVNKFKVFVPHVSRLTLTSTCCKEETGGL